MLKRKLKQALSIMLAFMLMFGSLFVHVKPLESSATENYRLWRQFDPRWGSIQMGNTTMARSGCLVTAIAILAVHSGSKNPNTFTPGYFANSLNSINAFDSGGAIASWASITKVIPDVKVVTYTGFNSSTQSGKAAEIKQQMQKGYHVVCNVNGHWVYVEGVDGDDVYMIDPAKDDILMFDSYGNSNVIAMEVMTAKNPPSDVIGALTTTSLTTTTAPETTTTTAATTTTTETTTTTTLTSTTTVPPTTTSTTTTSTTTTTTTTATTTSTTTTSTTTTTTASLSTTTTPVTTTASPPDYSESICVTALAAANSDIEGNNFLSYIERGNVVKVLSVKDGMAEIRYGDSVAYVAEAFLVPAAKHEKSIMGDVNFDGIVDIRDLSLINDYIFAKPRLPDGISLFTDEQLRASDVSGDGITDKKDLTAIMLVVCK